MIVVPFDSKACVAPVFRELVEQLSIPSTSEVDFPYDWVLTEDNDVVVLKELSRPDLKPLYVDLIPTRRRYKSLPITKRGSLARALGRSTKTVIDATAGWGQDAMLAWMMGYHVTAIERSPAIGALLLDGWRRFKRYEQANRYPTVIVGDAKSYLVKHCADCIYLDPMFVFRKKRSSLAKRRLRVLRELVGDDEDREMLFESAWGAADKRVVTKRPTHAKPWFRPDQTFSGKMMCYDVYLKN
ncbi:MAG: class I SAM-dependent methyltransferase [Arenicellales bacterium]|nr:class I SAM-dependent methyltransferase [Arenicellales bacterium]